MPKRARLDAELVRRKLAGSRNEAKLQIEAGYVVVNGVPTVTPATLVGADASIKIEGSARRFVSRGGEKLDGALARLNVVVEGRKWLDAGASTGGFTDRLLKGGASGVAAVDVGYGQLDWRLRNDPRVTVIERTNVRSLRPADLPWVPDGVVADLSFISLRTVLPALVDVIAPHGEMVLLVKPQFEVGREDLGRGGVVRDPALWRRSLGEVVAAASDLGVGLVDAIPSPLQGPAGNHEFFVQLRRGAQGEGALLDSAVQELT